VACLLLPRPAPLPLFLVLTLSARLDCRITKLVEEEVEHDEAFWGQAALKEVCRLQMNNFFFPFRIVLELLCFFLFLSRRTKRMITIRKSRMLAMSSTVISVNK
jgi:hypothetical protein